jgi:hypothetical protein
MRKVLAIGRPTKIMLLKMSNIVSREQADLGPAAKGWAFARLLLRVRFLRKLGTLSTHGYLAETGWVRSVCRAETAIDATAPLPWATFPYIAFLGPRLRTDLRLFEYGAGSSTLYYAQRVREVFAVEHDEAFVRALAPHLPGNAHLVHEPLHAESYVRAMVQAGGRFDVAVVDGRDRVRCAAVALTRLTAGGVLVLDDAERDEYGAATAAWTAAGFRRLDFWGLAPGSVGTKSTAIFYRPENCLGL